MISKSHAIRSITKHIQHSAATYNIPQAVSSTIVGNTNNSVFQQNQQQPQQITQARSKHSNRQVKRLFKKHPAFLRISQRNGTQPKKDVTPPPQLQFEPIYDPPIVLKNGWSQPPMEEEILKKRDELPFGVKRTGGKPNGAVGFLPVYSNFRLGGSQQTTIIKKVSGDKDLFLNELRAVLSISADDKDAIRIRASGGTFEVNGNRTREIKTWLCQLGF